jgi:hypothetical protein
MYHGLVPKILTRHPSELSLLADAGVSASRAAAVAMAVGVAEVLLGVWVLVSTPRRWPFGVTAVLMLVALLAVAIRSPGALVAAFNPVSLNLSVLALCVAGWLTAEDRPLARRCLRRRPEES